MADIPLTPRGVLGVGCGSGCGCGSKGGAKSNVIGMSDIGLVKRNAGPADDRVGLVKMVAASSPSGEDAAAAGVRFTAEQKRRMKEAPGNPASYRIVAIRRSIQIFCFLLFVLFFFMTTATSQYIGGVPKNLFMTMDFLNTLKNSIASHRLPIYAIGPSLFILILTMWGGRIFCGWICPLGTAIDIGDKLLFRKGRLFYTKKRSDTRRF